MSKAKKKAVSFPSPISSIKHPEETRTNIPTEELRGFMVEDEKAPKVVLYPRDPSLDPQLVWRGKDEQDSKPLEVESVPIYIQEKIHPQAIIENLRETAMSGDEPELRLFNDFNGIKFEDQIDFYHHQQHWQNRMILGDSLLVMNSLAEKEGLKGKVQMVFIDPPYGIKFGSNWQVSIQKNQVRDGKTEDATRQPEQVKAFRDTWELGIHSYLSYLRDRVQTAHVLLSDTGSCFVQIGEENVHLIRGIMDEVFGTENFCSQIPFVKTSGQSSQLVASVTDYLVWYAKKRSNVKYRQLYSAKVAGGEGGINYTQLEQETGERRTLNKEEKLDWVNVIGRVFSYGPLTSADEGESGTYPFEFQGTAYVPKGEHWKTSRNGLYRLNLSNRIAAVGKLVKFVRYFKDYPVIPINNFWSDTSAGGFSGERYYVVQTNTKVIERCIQMCTDPGDLVLDPTCGSGTTAYVAEQWGRRWITIDTSRVALALARTRLMAGKYPYYLLKDTTQGRKREMELTFGSGAAANLTETLPRVKSQEEPDIRQGFVYKRVPHITLKSIANNEEIDVIYERYQQQMEPLRAELNKLTKSNWEEWEIPRELPGARAAGQPPPNPRLQKAGELLESWWKLRRARQKEIDDSIARRADVEFLYDQPEEDKKRIRVAGPFTVESLSPHRVLSTDESPIGGAPEVDRDGLNHPPLLASASPALKRRGSEDESDFVSVILDNLRRNSIKTTHKEERLKFDRIETYPSPYIHAIGYYTDTEGKEKKAAITVGPEHGTVSPDLVREAAKAAVQSIESFDSLYVLGFSFDPYVDTERTKLGKLQVVMTRMNPDLAMGDDLLKKTGAGNLFMVFGEPDIELKKAKNGTYTVEIKGLDVYDPTTGQVRSNSTNDIACWFIDTNYNGESFFVRHAYFTGDKDPYDKLKRALKAEIDEAAWSMLYRTESMPFDKPSKGKIAVKVINHYGDEVLKVYEVK
jgi:adenine-specific DNA-methyltransferase